MAARRKYKVDRINKIISLAKVNIMISQRKIDLPGSSQHQNHGKNRQQGHALGQHDPQECPTMDDQERFAGGPASKENVENQSK